MPSGLQTAAAAATNVDAPDPGRWKSLAVILAAAFLVGLDFFVVNVSIPAIRADLMATFAEVQLVIASYGLTYAVLLISGGRLGDVYGRKRMFIWGVSAFTVASLLCGLAPVTVVPDCGSRTARNRWSFAVSTGALDHAGDLSGD